MPIELEAKMKVPEHGPVRARLLECAATPLGEWLEIDVFFDTLDGTLLAADRGLRLRTRRDRASGRQNCILTFKGPAGTARLKQREEIEFGVSSADAATQLLERLGFHANIRYEKRRQSWRLDRCRVELDELPQLGHFVEIEGPQEDSVLLVREKLGLSQAPLITTPYVAMVAALLRPDGTVGTGCLQFS